MVTWVLSETSGNCEGICPTGTMCEDGVWGIDDQESLEGVAALVTGLTCAEYADGTYRAASDSPTSGMHQGPYVDVSGTCYYEDSEQNQDVSCQALVRDNDRRICRCTSCTAVANSVGDVTCTSADDSQVGGCADGYHKVDGTADICEPNVQTCDDTNPNVAGANMDAIAENACDGTQAGDTCGHTCAYGFDGGSVTCDAGSGNADGTWNVIPCTDINECAADTDNCDTNAACANTPGSFTCACDSGYTGDGTSCTVVPPRTCADTLQVGTSSALTAFDCSGHANSLNATPASITCASDSCTEEECCTVTPGNCSGYNCATHAKLLADNPESVTCAAATCTDEECCTVSCTSVDNAASGATYTCSDASSSVVSACADGYTKQADGHRCCGDVDNAAADATYTCEPDGTRSKISACAEGYWLDNGGDTDVCTACTVVEHAAAGATYTCSGAESSSVSDCAEGYTKHEDGHRCCGDVEHAASDATYTCSDASSSLVSDCAEGYTKQEDGHRCCGDVENAAADATYTCEADGTLSQISACADDYSHVDNSATNTCTDPDNGNTCNAYFANRDTCTKVTGGDPRMDATDNPCVFAAAAADTCEANTCEIPAPIPEGYMFPRGCTTTYTIGQNHCSPVCADGYHGRPIVTCAGGGGGTTLAGCDPNVCISPTTPVAGYILPECTVDQDTGDINCDEPTCADGFFGNPKLTCDSHNVENPAELSLSGCYPKTERLLGTQGGQHRITSSSTSSTSLFSNVSWITIILIALAFFALLASINILFKKNNIQTNLSSVEIQK